MPQDVCSHRGWCIIQRAQRGHRVAALQERRDVIYAGHPLARIAAPDRRHAIANSLPEPAALTVLLSVSCWSLQIGSLVHGAELT